ncbi:MAG: exopolyphosphatase [Lachnospiraceae bacterium]|nr:exopolyphosphatase [Lachnospiraceae bacterium]
MAYTTFAAIDVGSNDVAMKIYQISAGKGIKQIDYVSQYLAIGRDTYRYGKIRSELIDELSQVLSRFQKKMKEYQVDAYLAYASSALREADNREFILDQIYLKTGIDINVLSNSERHYLMYKGIASRTVDFNNVIQKNTAIIDMGAGSIQISIFDKQALSVTQNLKIGSMRLKGLLEGNQKIGAGYKDMLAEYISNEIDSFSNYFMKDKSIKNIIAVGDEIDAMRRLAPELHITDSIDSNQMAIIYDRIVKTSAEDISDKYEIALEVADILLPAAEIYKCFLDRSKAEIIWTPGIDLCDSIAAEYADESGKVKLSHDFKQDIVSMAKSVSKRYHSNRAHISNVSNIGLEIFDTMKDIHGLTSRNRLYLQIAIILHDCGKYITMNAGGRESYNIIMASEIIGLSHRERELVAMIVMYNTVYLPAFSELEGELSREEYITITKLIAILRVANAMDRSHKQKVGKIEVERKNKKLMLNVDSLADISLEKVLFEPKADFFEEVYGIRPIIKQRRNF